MTKQEVNKLLALMKANYSNAFRNMSREEKYMLLESWTFVLQDIDADVALIAAMKLISTSKWLPMVSEIREKAKALYGEAICLEAEALLDGGSVTRDQQMAEHIVQRTAHLRGEGSSELSLRAILRNPDYAALGGQGGFSLLEVGGQYETGYNREEDA